LQFPKEIYFLVGAPGSGKGTMTRQILHERGLTCQPIVASDLLLTPEMRALKDKGILVSDQTIVSLVFQKLLDKQYTNGVVVDGFPRTRVQAECISLLYDFMLQLRKEFLNTEYVEHFRRPVFRISVLFVEEGVSVERQLKRGQRVKEHNRIVMDTGIGQLLEERVTDFNAEAAKLRYKHFKENIYDSIQKLKQKFYYNLIDASGTPEQVIEKVNEEFKYQSTMELGKETFDAISSVPPVEEITKHARQQLIRRLDGYQLKHYQLFKDVVTVIEKEFLHIIRRQALSGVAIIRSENQLFSDPLALNIAMDVLTERGYQVILDMERKQIPFRINKETFEFEHRERKTYHFQIQFTPPKIRN